MTANGQGLGCWGILSIPIVTIAIGGREDNISGILLKDFTLNPFLSNQSISLEKISELRYKLAQPFWRICQSRLFGLWSLSLNKKLMNWSYVSIANALLCTSISLVNLSS